MTYSLDQLTKAIGALRMQVSRALTSAVSKGVGGVSLVMSVMSGELALKSINATNNKIAITDDTVNHEIDIAVVEANLDIGAMGGTLLIAHGGTGQVTAPAALSALGGQPLDATLTALAALASTGFIAETGVDTFAQRQLAAGSSKISISNPAGIAGNPTIDAVEANFSLAAMGGTVGIGQGGTGQTSAAAALSALGGQPLDATLTAWAAYNTNGMLAQTAADTFTGRTLTAGSSKLSISNGSGVSGNPTLDVVPANIALDTLGAPTDITTLNASTSQHGLLPKLDGSAAKFLSGAGTWLTPTAALPDAVYTRQGTGAANQTVPSSYAMYVPGTYEIAAAQTLELVGTMEIG